MRNRRIIAALTVRSSASAILIFVGIVEAGIHLKHSLRWFDVGYFIIPLRSFWFVCYYNCIWIFSAHVNPVNYNNKQQHKRTADEANVVAAACTTGKNDSDGGDRTRGRIDRIEVGWVVQYMLLDIVIVLICLYFRLM